jgi:Tfp pilus assembly protein PilF
MRTTFRTAVNFALVILALTVISSFTFAAYLLFRPAATAESAVIARPVTFEGLLAAGDRHLARKQAEQALFAYRRARAIRPDSPAAQAGVARGEVLAGRQQDATIEYERALVLAPSDEPLMRELAILYSYRERTWREAEEMFQRYVALRPQDTDAQLRLARLLGWRGKGAAAARIFARPAVSKVMTVDDHTAYAYALINVGDTRGAEAVITRLLARGHQDPRLTLQLAHIYASRREWDAAGPLFRQLLRNDPGNAQLNRSYGLGLLAQRRYAEAIEPLRIASRALRTDGTIGLAHARALRSAGQRAGAAREFERIMPLHARDAAVTREYADLLLELKQYRPAEQQYKRALALGLADARLYVALSGSLRATRRPREALPYLQQAYRLAPTERLAFELARVLHQTGHSRQALALLDSPSAAGTSRASASAP